MSGKRRFYLLKIFVGVGVLLTSALFSYGFEDPAQKIETLLRSAAAKGEFSGGVIVAKGGKTIYQGAVGYANREWKIPNTTKTRFRINSVTKQFTSLIIMQLVESGQVKLDDPISKYLPDFPKPQGERVTVRNLLMNTSGLPSLDTPLFYKNDVDPRLTDSAYVIKTFVSGKLRFAPGSKFGYNNADFIVLGALIEKLSGKSYGRNLTERILKPLGMQNTDLIGGNEIIENLASGYIYADKTYRREPAYGIANYAAAGAMYSTLEDMLLWNEALIENKLLSKANTKIMFTAMPELGFVALGSWVYDLKFSGDKSYTLIERQGAIGGCSSLNIISVEDKLSVIFLGNVGTETLFRTYAGQGLSYKILTATLK